MSDLHAYHPELAVLGALAALASWILRRRLPAHPADVGALVVAVVLMAEGQIPPLVPVALAVLVAAPHLPGLVGHLTVAVGGLGLLMARGGLPDGLRLLLLVALVVALAPPHPDDPMHAPVTRLAVLGGALVAVFLGGPDTEASVAWGAATVVGLGLVAAFPAAAPAPLATWGVVAFEIVDAYRGRPAGAVASIVVVGALAGMRFVQPKIDPRRPMARNLLHVPIPLWMVATVSCASMWIMARTLGLRHHASVREAIGASALAVVLAGLGALSETPVPGRRPPG